MSIGFQLAISKVKEEAKNSAPTKGRACRERGLFRRPVGVVDAISSSAREIDVLSMFLQQ